MISRNLKKSDVAQLAMVSRAAVTRWFREVKREGWVNVESRTLFQLASGLGVPAESLIKPVADLTPYRVWFLWDHLYPSMEHFVQALVQGRLPAIARLVQEIGLDEAKYVIGRKAIALFPVYKKIMKPSRQEYYQNLWSLYSSKGFQLRKDKERKPFSQEARTLSAAFKAQKKIK